MCADIIHLDTAEPDGDLAEALRRLDIAVRTNSMYPASAPAVVKAHGIAHASLVAAIGDAPITLQIRPNEVSWVDARSREARSVVLERLAAQLHRRRVARLTLGPGLPLDSVETLISTLAQQEFEHDGDTLLIGGVPGIRADALELQGLVEGGSQRFDPNDVWGQILAGFGSATGGSQPQWAQLASDPDTAGDFFRWALDPDRQPAEMARHSQTDGYTLLVEQIAGRAPEVANLMQTLAQTSAELFDELDPEAWIEVLTDPLPLHTGETGEPTDLTKRVASNLSGGQVMRLVNYAMQSRSRATPRLYKFLSRVVTNRPDRSQIASRAVQIAERSSVDIEEAWPKLVEVMTGENPEPFVNDDYRAVLEHEPSHEKSPWNNAKIRARFGELDDDSLRVRKARIAHSLLVSNCESRFYEHLVSAIEGALKTLVRMDELALLEEILSTLAHHASDTSRITEQRERARQALECIQQPELTVLLVRRLARSGADSFYALWRIVEHLGPDLLPELLEALATTRSPSYRHHLLRILRAMNPLPVEEFAEPLADPRTPYVRDFVWVLAELRRPEIAPLLLEAARHRNATVRREAVSGFAFLPDEASELALLEALADTTLEVRVAALRAFRQRFQSRSQELLLSYLALPNWNGRNTRLLAAAARALGQIGDEVALAALIPLTRRIWLFRRRRRTATQASVAAVHSIKQRHQQQREQQERERKRQEREQEQHEATAAPQPQDTARAA